MVLVETCSTENGRSLPNRQRLGRYLVFGLLTGVFFARCSYLSADEVLCEEAVAKLEECCGQTNPAVVGLRCIYKKGNSGCESPNRPHVPRATAVCLLDQSCAELLPSGICNGDTWMPAKECATCIDSSVDGGTKTCCTTFKEPPCPGL